MSRRPACPPTARMMRSARHARPSRPVTVCGSVKWTGPRCSTRSMPLRRSWSARCFFSKAWRATRSLLARIAARLGRGGGPSSPKVAHEVQSRASLAERASVRTGPGPRLRLVPPTWSASSRVTLAPSWRACMAAVTPAGPPPTTEQINIARSCPVDVLRWRRYRAAGATDLAHGRTVPETGSDPGGHHGAYLREAMAHALAAPDRPCGV